MTPYVEVRTLPSEAARRWIAVIAIALLIVPVGALLPGGATDPASRAAAMLAILILAPILGFALARPRETITIDATANVITRRTVGELPNPRAHVERWPLAAARHAELEDLGYGTHPEWGVRIDLDGDEPLHLETFSDRDLAQNTLDHLVLLGIPGISRAQLRAAELAAEPPTVWI